MRKFGGRTGTVAAVLSVLTGVLVGGLVAADPAAAAASCNSTSAISRNGFNFTIPSVGHNTKKFKCVLGVGNQGAAVKSLQTQLNQCYLKTSSVQGHQRVLDEALDPDGIYGTLTKKAVKAVQQHHDIDDDGVYGPHTRAAMFFFVERDRDGRPFCRKFGA
jgi:Putative peptidoglycan binding domain